MSGHDISIEPHISASLEASSPSAPFQVPVLAPPSDDPQTPLPLPTNPESESLLAAEACARGLWQKAHDSHQRDGLRADQSLEGKSSEQLVRYMMEERGFSEAAARAAVAVYPARVLAKLHRETPSGMPTVGQLRAASDEEWEEKSWHP